MHPDNSFSKGLVVKMLTLLQKKKKISSYLNTVYSVETLFILLSRGCLLLTSGSVAPPFRKFPIKIISHDNWTGVHLQCSSIYIYCLFYNRQNFDSYFKSMMILWTCKSCSCSSVSDKWKCEGKSCIQIWKEDIQDICTQRKFLDRNNEEV